MVRPEPTYPISRLIREIQKSSGLRSGAFVRSLGYSNISGGLRSLDRWVGSGEGDPYFLRKLVEVYGQAEQVKAALEDTAPILVAEEKQARIDEELRDRARFRPYVYVESSERTPSQICIAIFMGLRMKLLKLPEEWLDLSVDECLPLVQEFVRQHYAEKHGQCQFFGRITGFRFVHSYDESTRLAIDGSVVAREPGHFVGPNASLSLRKKKWLNIR
jgi:hypothetical protein